MTHSLLSSDVAVPGLPAGREAAAIGEDLRVSDGRRDIPSSVLIVGGDAAFKSGGFVFSVEDMIGVAESCSSPGERSDR